MAIFSFDYGRVVLMSTLVASSSSGVVYNVGNSNGSLSNIHDLYNAPRLISYNMFKCRC